MAIRRTATIVRYHVYGTPHFELTVQYRNETLAWSHRVNGTLCTAFATVQEDRSATDPHRARTRRDVQRCEEIARKHGFTHVRFTGEWPIGGTPTGGAL